MNVWINCCEKPKNRKYNNIPVSLHKSLENAINNLNPGETAYGPYYLDDVVYNNKINIVMNISNDKDVLNKPVIVSNINKNNLLVKYPPTQYKIYSYIL
jgi:hypothetical protein